MNGGEVSEYNKRAEYLYDRGFRRGRFNEYERRNGRTDRDSLDMVYKRQNGWCAGGIRFEVGPFPDPVTAYVAAELADWGRT